MDESYPFYEFFEGVGLTEEHDFFVVFVFDVQSLSFSHFVEGNVDQPYHLSLCFLSAFRVEVPILDFPLPHGLILTLKI